MGRYKLPIIIIVISIISISIITINFVARLWTLSFAEDCLSRAGNHIQLPYSMWGLTYSK